MEVAIGAHMVVTLAAVAGVGAVAGAWVVVERVEAVRAADGMAVTLVVGFLAVVAKLAALA